MACLLGRRGAGVARPRRPARGWFGWRGGVAASRLGGGGLAEGYLAERRRPPRVGQKSAGRGGVPPGNPAAGAAAQPGGWGAGARRSAGPGGLPGVVWGARRLCSEQIRSGGLAGGNWRSGGAQRKSAGLGGEAAGSAGDGRARLPASGRSRGAACTEAWRRVVGGPAGRGGQQRAVRGPAGGQLDSELSRKGGRGALEQVFWRLLGRRGVAPNFLTAGGTQRPGSG